MADDKQPLIPASAEDLKTALSHALRFNGRKSWGKGTELMANITAEHLVEHLTLAGFVLMRKPPAPGHRTPASRKD